MKFCHFVMLQDLNFNFQTVILPEALTAFQAEEPSVVRIVRDLEVLVSWIDSPLDSVIETLEQLVVNATTLGGVAFALSVSLFVHRYYFCFVLGEFHSVVLCFEWFDNKCYGIYRAMLCIRGTSYGPVSVCLSPSVHPSVCPSQVGVLLKRLNIGSHKQHHTIVQGLWSQR